MPRKLDPSRIADKMVRKAQQASQDYRDGVNAVTEAPTAKAARKKEKMRAGINRALDEGKWEAGLASVSLEDWKAAANDKGASRYAGGVAAARPKIQAFLEEYLPYAEQVSRTIDAMPDVTEGDRDARRDEATRLMRQFRRTRRRR